MFNVYDENGRKLTVYAVRTIDGNTEFLFYFGQWEWCGADSFSV